MAFELVGTVRLTAFKGPFCKIQGQTNVIKRASEEEDARSLSSVQGSVAVADIETPK